MKSKVWIVMFLVVVFAEVGSGRGEVSAMMAEETSGLPVSEGVAMPSQAVVPTIEIAKRNAIVNAVKGEVYVMKAGEDKWVPAQVKMELCAGDKISSRKKSNAEILLDDGSIIKLKENTTFEIQELGEEPETKTKKSLFKMLLGKLWAKVHLATAGKFKIVTPAAIAGVRGTEFALSVKEDNSSEILVFEGEVEMMGQEAGQMWTMVIPTGQAMSTTPAGGQQPLREIKPEEAKEWKSFAEGKDEEAKKEEKKEEDKEKPEEIKSEKAKGRVPAGGRGWGVDGGIGAVNLNGIMYYRVAVQPVFKIGKFKAALNLNVTWNDTVGLKPWELEDYLNLILYLQWAEKGEKPVYTRFGSIENATLGQGFIVNRYSNLTPKASNKGYRNLGIEFDLDLDKWGFESLLNNVLQPGLIGLRMFYRPIGPLTVGLTYATDINTGPEFLRTSGDTPVQEASTQIVGADIGLPIIGKILGWYADFGWIINHGNGWASGFKGGIGPVAYRFEYRSLDSDFIPGYFNNYYEFSKPVSIPVRTGERSNGWYGELAANILKFATLNFYYEDARNSAGATRAGYPWIHGLLSLNADLFTALIRQRISASASYDQRDLCLLDQTAQTAIFEGRLLYGISENVDMIYVYTQRYDASGQPVRTSSVQTQIHF